MSAVAREFIIVARVGELDPFLGPQQQDLFLGRIGGGAGKLDALGRRLATSLTVDLWHRCLPGRLSP